MRRLHAIPILFIISFFLAPALTSADVRIEMKNGMTITADSCTESHGKVVCFKMGGTFELEKQDIASVKKTKGKAGNSDGDRPSSEAGEAQPDLKQSEPKTAESNAPRSWAEESKARLDRIRQRKQELTAEREKLLADREKLQQDRKSAPDWMTTDRYEDLKKRSDALDERIKGFNDEVKRLDQEEKTILDSPNGVGPVTP